MQIQDEFQRLLDAACAKKQDDQRQPDHLEKMAHEATEQLRESRLQIAHMKVLLAVAQEEVKARRPPQSYRQYMKSEAWLERRAAALQVDGYRCRVCNGRDDLQVHHRTYERFGEEELGDLTTLCDGCHEAFHRTRRVFRPVEEDGGES